MADINLQELGLKTGDIITEATFNTLSNNFSDIQTQGNAHESTLNEHSNKIGVLNELPTTDKTSVVNSIKEINADLLDIEQQAVDNMKQSEYLASNKLDAFLNLEMQPSAKASDPSYFCDAPTWKSDDYINNLYEPLRQSDTNYITRTLLGKDQSDMYNIYKYEFTPSNYENTIILIGALHGNEATGALALYRMLWNIVNKSDKYTQLNYIKNKIKLVVIPFANPYGLNNGIRHNVNGVDLNRNFNYRWDTYTSQSAYDYKGVSVASEKETQYIQQVIDENNNAIAYLDFHSLFNEQFYYYVPQYEETNRNIIVDLANDWKSIDSNRIIKFGNTPNPSALNYASYNYGMNSCNAEFGDGMITTQYGATEITECTKYYVNVLLRYIKLSAKATAKKSIEPYSKLIYAYFDTAYHVQIPNSSTIYVYNPSEMQKISQLEYSFSADCDGIVLITGEVTLTNDTTNSINFITPYIYQDRTFFGAGSFMQYKPAESYYEGAGRTTLSFSHESEVLVSNGMHGDVKIGIYGLATAGVCKIGRYKLKITFIPSARRDRFGLTRINNDYTQEKLY